jgi:hypothetical protein
MRRFHFVSLVAALPVLALACSSKSDDLGRSNPSKNPDSEQSDGNTPSGTAT